MNYTPAASAATGAAGLAYTGAETTWGIILGLTLLSAGLILMRLRRKTEV